MAKRNYGVLQDGTIFRFDTDTMNLSEDRDLVCLARYIREKKGQDAIHRFGEHYNRQSLTSWGEIVSTKEFKDEIGNPNWEPVWVYLKSSAEAFSSTLLRRINMLQAKWDRFLAGVLVDSTKKRPAPSKKEAGATKKAKLEEDE